MSRWKERSNGTQSDTEFKQLLNTLEREKGKMTTALDQLKSMKSDKSCLEELVICYIINKLYWTEKIITNLIIMQIFYSA